MDLARGSLLAALSRLGALIEVVAQPAYTWMFGVATYGVYTVLWAAVNIVENVVDLSMTQALQRVVPTEDEHQAHAAVRLALIVSVLPATLLALLATLAAPTLAAYVSAAPEDLASLPTAIRLFAWALPLWTFVEVATSAARARRAFGPEIRLRIFWEQIARLGFATAFFLGGIDSLGLIVAHLASLALTALLAVRLLARYYQPRLLLTARATPATRRALIATGFSTLPAALARRLFIDLPPILLNLMLPGARGAVAAGLFGIARKIATVPLIVRQAFQYVLAPLASAQARVDRSGIAPLYRFATRISTALVIPLAAVLVSTADEILSLFAPEARAAWPLVVILVLGRAVEAIVGPATPVVEMTGHRGLPLLNAVIGTGAWLLLAWLLVPTYNGTGMALAVSVGTILTAWAAAIELRLSDGISALDRRLAIGVAATLAASAMIFAADRAVDLFLAPLGAPANAAAILLLFPVAAWIGLRTTLGREDRRALGAIGRRLRLSP